MGAGDSTAYDAAAALLAASAAALPSPPDRSFVTWEAPTPDGDSCSQLTVHITGMSPSPTTLPIGGLSEGFRARDLGGLVPLIGFQVTRHRCVTRAENPPASAQQADATALATEMWRVWNTLIQGQMSKSLFAEGVQVYWDECVPVQKQGGVAGWRINLRVSFNHYQPS